MYRSYLKYFDQLLPTELMYDFKFLFGLYLQHLFFIGEIYSKSVGIVYNCHYLLF
jgi:hypothetical protein